MSFLSIIAILTLHFVIITRIEYDFEIEFD